IRFV
ncbi:unnamed protein product, partial [Allacma fusca]